MRIPFYLPKIQLILYLGLIYLTAIINYPNFYTFIHLLLGVFYTVAADLIFLRIRKVKLFLPSAAVVTGIIIALLISPNQPFYIPIIAAVLAMFSKNFIRVNNKHIFNPAAFGLFMAGIILGFNISWWGVSFQNLLPLKLESLFFLILLLPALLSVIKLRRWGNVVTFLFVYYLTSFILTRNFGFNTLLDPTAIFFSLVMLPEPITSPVKINKQIMFGVMVAVLSYLLVMPEILAELIPDPLVAALLISNVIFFRIR